MTSVTDRLRNKRVLILALFVAISWFFLQTGSVTDHETSTDLGGFVVVLAMQDDTAPRLQGLPIPNSTRRDNRADSTETPSRSLKHASILLHRAANAIDKDHVLAVQLIREVISILRYQVIPALLDHNSTLVPIRSLPRVLEQGMNRGESMSHASQSLCQHESSLSDEKGT